ncbi:TetR/AcrR family transcriptional regulator [Staphylococcus succinus]|nr:TetR/AcrR family transcriptional regulator [Staphylococcus succinus]RIN25023.1 TetR/AcrR family transcriptional regulator [Staphylococcus succinus]RIN40958.1 TetR/AcrR family transcriptional regulator [Staphylococcus succinus]
MFTQLHKDKQNNIINVAMNEFVKNGFDKTSTNHIVKKAHISKGSLFNYFNNKKDLYLYLIDFSIQTIETMYEHIDFKERDLFQRIENIGLQKLYIQQKSPKVFDFLKSLPQESSAEVQDIIKEKISSTYEEGTKKIFHNLDYSKFREDIDIEKAIEILNWTMLGFGTKTLTQITTFDNSSQFGETYLNEWKQYARILKYSFYK